MTDKNMNIGVKINPMSENVFFSTFGNGTRFEVFSDGFNLGKLKMGFQKYNPATNKQIDYIPMYMSVDKALVLANDILSGKLAAAAKLKQQSKPNEIVTVYKSQGGQPAVKAKRADGKPLYREFSISKGKLWLLKATSGPGATTETGGYIPDGKPDSTVSVGLSDDALKAFALMFQENYRAYLSAQYVATLLQGTSSQSASKSYGDEMNDQFDFD